MTPILFFLCCAILTGDTQEFRHWIGGRDAGTLSVSVSGNRAVTHSRLVVERRGAMVVQDLAQEISKGKNGDMTINWTFAPAPSQHREPLRGRASWSPKKAGALRVSTPGMADTLLPITSDALLWPPDTDKKMRLAASEMTPLRIATFSFASSTSSTLDVKPERADPLDGFEDSVRFGGTLREGVSLSQVTSWISPSAGLVRQVSASGGLIVVTQRAELGPPESFGPVLFEWTLRRLPQIPFLAWRNEFIVSGLPDLEEGPRQKKLDQGEYQLSRATLPSPEESRQLPYRSAGEASHDDAVYIADSPLLGLDTPAIVGLVSRINARKGATRWELACLVNSFVFEHIQDKGLEVGFAPAFDVAVNPSGDCTEHTVLMVALLRRLGVPARAALGWAALDVGGETSLGLHSWVEAKIGRRWIPFDPTFGQSPAGAFRVASSVSSLSSIADLTWDFGLPQEAALGVNVTPVEVLGSRAVIDDLCLSVSQGVWRSSDRGLCWEHPRLGRLPVSGNVRSLPAADSKAIHVPEGSPARYTGSLRQLAIDCGQCRWLYLEGLDEGAALEALRELKVESSSP